MELKPILSIIVPSYNTGKYVEKCLPHFIDERLNGKIKVFLIDDGATDNTPTLLKKYSATYPSFFQYVHKENGGHGSVINTGTFDYVNTKYFKIVDGDDWIEPDSLYDLVSYLYRTDDDMVVNGVKLVCSDSSKIVNPVSTKKFVEKTTYGSELLPNLVFCTIHAITYKASIFKTNNILMPERVFYEDNLYRLYPLRFIRKISFINSPVYCYFLGNPEQSVSNVGIIKHYEDSVIVRKLALKYYLANQQKVDPNTKTMMEDIIANGTVNFRSVLIKFPDNSDARKELCHIYNEIKKIPGIVKALKRKKANRLMIFLRFRFLTLFRKILKIS